jgi:hypothetical protein
MKMTQMVKNTARIAACLLFATLIAGCATYDRKVTLLYQPVVNAGGGSGELYLAASGRRAGTGKTGAVQWVIGKVENSDGEQVGNIVTTVSPNDMILDAFSRELKVAGYKVTQVNTLPADVSKGVVISLIDMSLEEVVSIVKADGQSRLTVTLELWRNGKNFKKLYYETRFSDFAIKDRDLLLPTTLQKTLQELMKQAVPEIIRQIGT